MANNSTNIATLSIKELLGNDNFYRIPVYQRNYAWGEGEITQLIQDIIDYIPKNLAEAKNYYLGTLVVYERKENGKVIYETIDGQQRLTTLSILLSVIKNKYSEINTYWFKNISLEFESRKIATSTLEAAYNLGNFGDNYDYNQGIKNAYQLMERILPIKIKEANSDIGMFTKYLFENVQILRVPVPTDTNLNHYFEIMNSRGEQLEKHEILKATLLSFFNDIKDEEQKTLYSQVFHLIWEACSNMEKYVQSGFGVEQRNRVFKASDWNTFTPNNYDDLCDKLKETLKNKEGDFIHVENELSIDYIIAGKHIKDKQESKETEDSPDKFNSIINFPNFLLHVLRVQSKEDIPLDDKRLIDSFKQALEKQTDKVAFVKTFIFNLLICKYLFDKYILKREFRAGKDEWCLKQVKCYENKTGYVTTFGGNENETTDNHKIIMLLSMFHVSTPTLLYKYWLNAALGFVFEKQNVEAKEYIDYLENLAKTFIFDRFLANKPLEYYVMISTNGGKCRNKQEDVDLTKLTFGNIANNLVFNFLDYLLWKEEGSNDNIIKNFDFTFRSSVEHYYPQNPKEGFRKLELNTLNSFGNLCLISHSKNASLNNYMPFSKKEHYKNNTIDSVKQHIMMNRYSPENWNEGSINEHNEKMCKLFLNQLSNE